MGERARWLSAVLIVTAIATIGIGVRYWPMPEAATARLTSRSLEFSLISPAPTLRASGVPVATTVDRSPNRIGVEAPVTAVARVADAQNAAAAENDRPAAPASTHASASDGAIAARQLATVALASAPRLHASSGHVSRIAAGERQEPIAASTLLASVDPTPDSEPFYGFVEVPAAAVTRAVSVAGRGIKTGIRLTGAVFKAAF